jgi:hypothetical protein
VPLPQNIKLHIFINADFCEFNFHPFLQLNTVPVISMGGERRKARQVGGK